jgi:predicted RNase H-like nuclease
LHCVGIDGYPKGWVAVILRDGAFENALVGTRLAALVARLGDALAIGVDMPIGLPESGAREADLLARAMLGPRRSSVFITPPRAALEKGTIEEARAESTRLSGHSISSQAWALRDRIWEADAVAQADSRIREVHPEVSFAAAAERTLRWPKSTWAGLVERRSILIDVGIHLPDDIGEAGEAGVADVLDAAIGAWTAKRIASGEARSLPDQPGHRGGPVPVIWY